MSLVLASNEIVALPPEPNATGVEGGWEQRYTTAALLEVEQRLLTHLQIAAGRGVLDQAVIDQTVAGRPGLGRDTVDLTAILDTARIAGAKVVLVGDPRQVPEVGPGGGLAAALDRFGDRVVELIVNRRPHQAWEIEALDQLRHGAP